MNLDINSLDHAAYMREALKNAELARRGLP